MKYGPYNLEATIAHGEGTKPVPVLDRKEDVGVAYISAEHRMRTGAGRRLSVSAWMSFPVPVNIRNRADVRRRMLRAGCVLRRLVAQKGWHYLRECEP